MVLSCIDQLYFGYLTCVVEDLGEFVGRSTRDLPTYVICETAISLVDGIKLIV